MIGPLILRELRLASRQRSHHWLRVGGGAVVFFGLLSVWSQGMVGTIGTGRSVFRGLNLMLAAVIWIVAPLMTADCLSREKRDGTLSLLFLTSLRPWQLVSSKSAIHFLRAGMILMAAAPVLMVPVLMGGLGWMDVVRAILLHAGALGLALAAGLVASALCRRGYAARLVASALMTGGAAAFIGLLFAVRSAVFIATQASGAQASGWGRRVVAEWTWLSWRIRMPQTFWQDFTRSSTDWPAVLTAGLVFLGSVLLAIAAMYFASRAVERTWQDAPEAGRVGPWVRWFLEPRSGLSRWWRRRKALRDGNPMTWIYTARRMARLGRLGWMLFVISLAWLTGDMTTASGAAMAALPLFVAMAAGACGGFRQEIETGAMELLLITPLTPTEIMSGRVKALMWSFTPAMLASSVAMVLRGTISGWNGLNPVELLLVALPASVGVFGVLWVAMRVMATVGVAFSLSGFPFIGAFFMALLLVVGLPLPLLLSAVGSGPLGTSWRFTSMVLFVAFQALNLWRSGIFVRRQLLLRGYLPARPDSDDPGESSLATVGLPS